MGKRGPKPWEPTKEQRLIVELAVANGFTRAQIATLLETSVDSLERHCRTELETGDVKAGVKISAALNKKAMAGDTAAIIWWEKTRRGMKDTSRQEHTGKDGGPIEYQNLSDEEVAARIAAHEAARNGDRPTTH